MNVFVIILSLCNFWTNFVVISCNFAIIYEINDFRISEFSVSLQVKTTISIKICMSYTATYIGLNCSCLERTNSQYLMQKNASYLILVLC